MCQIRIHSSSSQRMNFTSVAKLPSHKSRARECLLCGHAYLFQEVFRYLIQRRLNPAVLACACQCSPVDMKENAPNSDVQLPCNIFLMKSLVGIRSLPPLIWCLMTSTVVAFKLPHSPEFFTTRHWLGHLLHASRP